MRKIKPHYIYAATYFSIGITTQKYNIKKRKKRYLGRTIKQTNKQKAQKTTQKENKTKSSHHHKSMRYCK